MRLNDERVQQTLEIDAVQVPDISDPKSKNGTYLVVTHPHPKYIAYSLKNWWKWVTLEWVIIILRLVFKSENMKAKEN